MTTISNDTMAEIAAVPQRMMQLWAAHNADAFADLFTADGVLVLPGAVQVGHDNIREFMEQAYATTYAGTTVTGSPIEIRPLGEGAVVLVTEGGVIPAGASAVPLENEIRASWVLTRRDDGWKIATYQNGPKNA